MHSIGFRSRGVRVGAAMVALAAASAGMFFAQAVPTPGRTSAELVASYQTLADAILAAKKSESNLVRAILSTAHSHATIELARAQKAMKSGDAKGAQGALEALAAYVAELGTEGDAAVAAVRKRLLDGGHHHNAVGEAKGIYDEGYVVVTRAAKQIFLAASRAIGQQAKAPNAAAIDSEWSKVEAAYVGLMKAAP